MTLLRLDMECSLCGARPNVRITEAQREKYAEDPDEALAGTWQCQRCGETHVLTAAVYKRAS